jgi:hypothetical protein
MVPRVYQTPLLDDALYLLVQSLAIDCLVGVDGVVPFAVLASLELVGRRDLMSGRKLQLFLLEEQVEDLPHLGHIEVILNGRLGSLESGARQRLRHLGPLDDGHLGLIG